MQNEVKKLKAGLASSQSRITAVEKKVDNVDNKVEALRGEVQSGFLQQQIFFKDQMAEFVKELKSSNTVEPTEKKVDDWSDEISPLRPLRQASPKLKLNGDNASSVQLTEGGVTKLELVVNTPNLGNVPYYHYNAPQHAPYGYTPTTAFFPPPPPTHTEVEKLRTTIKHLLH